MVGIYLIKNEVNNKVYIGQSIQIEHRKLQHFNAAKRGVDTHLYRAIRKYGESNFSFSVLEECTEMELDEKEKFYIKKYKSADSEFGYNYQLGGNRGNGVDRDRLIQLKTENPSISFTELAKLLGCDRCTVSRILKREFGQTRTFEYEEKLETAEKYKDEIIGMYKKKFTVKQISDIISVPIENIYLLLKKYNISSKKSYNKYEQYIVLVYDKFGRLFEQLYFSECKEKYGRDCVKAINGKQQTYKKLIFRKFKDTFPTQLSKDNGKFEFWN